MKQIKFPLINKNIVITRSKDQISDVKDLFQSKGAKIFDLPALIIEYPENLDPLDNALKTINEFHWIIFSSSNGIKFVERRLRDMGLCFKECSKNLKIAVVGEKTAKALKNLGLEADYIPPDYIAESLVKYFPISLYGLKILIPRVQSGGRNFIAENFRNSGAHVIEVPAYESKCPEFIPRATVDAFKRKAIHAIIFSSGKVVRNSAYLLQKEFGNDWLEILNNIKLFSIGPQTSAACKKVFGRIDREATLYSFEGLLDVTINYL
tara:strand:- start:205 stop:999 length:795 start_codon:yes stop_codon:yes gene_type:complete